MPLRRLFDEPTIARLGKVVEQLIREGAREQVPPIIRVSRDQAIPLSYAQQRLWLFNQLSPGDVSYNIPGAVRIQGTVDLNAFERSLREIVRRHESLRTRFVAVQGEPRQIIEESPVAELPVVDLSFVPQEQRDEEARRMALEEVRRPFDLGRGPLLRSKVLRLAEEDHVLVVTMHHIVSDAWSTGILVQEFSTLYSAFCTGKPSPLQELPV